MTDLQSTTDATEWAAEFMKYHGGPHLRNIDEATMITWFANAIEVGRSAGQRPREYGRPLNPYTHKCGPDCDI